MTGSMVERDSGRRRVRNSVEDCLYILEIWDEVCREEDENDDMDEESSCEEERVSWVGERTVAIELEEAIVQSSSFRTWPLDSNSEERLVSEECDSQNWRI